VRTGGQVPTRARGRIRLEFLTIPVAVAWIVALCLALGLATRNRPETTAYLAALYGCTAFFIRAYVVAWRVKSTFWQIATLLLTTTWTLVLCYLHADDAGARLIYASDAVHARPPQPLLFAPVALLATVLIWLLLHALVLGRGTRSIKRQ